MSEIKEFYNSIPPFTRYFMTGVFIQSFAMTYKFVSPYSLLLSFEQVFQLKSQFWRLFTTFLFAGPFSQGFLFSLLMMYFSLSKIEMHFKAKHAEFMTLILFCAVVCTFYAFIYGEYMVMHKSFLFALMYCWCKLEPDMTVSLWGFPVKSANLPWVMLFLSILTAGDPFQDLIGIAAGHTYIYIRLILPVSHGYHLLKSPHIWSKYLLDLVDYYYPRGGLNRRNIWGMGNDRQAGGSARVEGGGIREEPQANSGARFRAFGGSGVRLGGN